MGRAPHWLNIGQSIQALKRECQKACQIDGISSTLVMVIAGWQWSKGEVAKARPVVYGVGGSPSNNWNFTVDNPYDRHWHSRWRRLSLLFEDLRLPVPPYRLVWIPNLAPIYSGEVALQGHSILGRLFVPKASASALISVIRGVSERTPFVGRDCMVIFLPHPIHQRVEVAYEPDTDAKSIITIGGEQSSTPVAFSPWLVGGNAVYSPAVVIGNAGPRPLDEFAVAVRAPAPPPRDARGTRLLNYWGGQPRPRDPS